MIFQSKTHELAYKAFETKYVQQYIDMYKKRYNDTLTVEYEYIPPKGFFPQETHLLHVKIRILGIDFYEVKQIHLMFANLRTMEDLLIKTINRLLEPIPFVVVRKSEHPKGKGLING